MDSFFLNQIILLFFSELNTCSAILLTLLLILEFLYHLALNSSDGKASNIDKRKSLDSNFWKFFEIQSTETFESILKKQTLFNLY